LQPTVTEGSAGLGTTTKRRQMKMEPISYDELMSNAGMSGFVSFLLPAEAPPLPAEAPLEVETAVVVEAPRRARKGLVRKAEMVEDGHSLAEQAVYDSLWRAGMPLDGTANGGMENEDRTIRIGYHRLAQMTRLSWVSVKNNLRSLEKKLAIEVTGSENSATREGKCYRIYARPAILERRKQAGLEWVRRSRGVELLKKAH
jgi:hypothetical protein